MAQLPSPSPASPFTRVLAVGIGAVAVAAMFMVPARGPVPYATPSDAPRAEAAPRATSTPAGTGGWVVDLVDGATPEQVAHAEKALMGAKLTLAAPGAQDAGLYVTSLEELQAQYEAMQQSPEYLARLAQRSLPGDQDLTFEAFCGQLARDMDPDIEAIEPEQIFTADALPAGPVSLLGYPNDPGASGQWNLARIGAPTGWRAGGGKGVIVAVIDTGVTPSDELLNVLPGRSFVPGTESSADDHGHGTHVAGTIAQATNNGLGVAGIAPNATILPLKVLSANGSGQTSWIAAAIDDAADEGAQVINLSLGGGHSDVLVKAVERARNRGVIVVAAAGNTGGEGLGSPADAEHAIAVSAIGPDDTLTPYSTWGEGVEIAAPGGDKRVPGGGITQATMKNGTLALEEYQGTSMASPHVAGAMAVMLGMGATPEEAERRVLESADSADDPLRFGAGRLNLAAAVRSFAFAKQGLLFGVGAAMALAVSMLARLRGWTRIATIGTAAIAAGGLFFWPVLPLPPSSLGTLLSRPFQEWPTFTLFNVRLVGFPLWQSAIVPAFAVLFLSPSRHIGPLAVGLALGVGTYLLYGAATADIPLWLPMVWGRTWLTVNGTIALLAGLAGSGMLNMRQRAAA